MSRKRYATDLTDGQWARIAPLIPKAKPGGRPRSTDLREVINAILFVARSGCAWRLIPHDLPPFGTVYGYFRAFKAAGVWKKIHDNLRENVRRASGRKPTPSAAIIDSQSVKTTEEKWTLDSGRCVKCISLSILPKKEIAECDVNDGITPRLLRRK